MLLKSFFEKNTKTVTFVLGCQRSGTTMLLNLLSQAPLVSLYREGNTSAMENYRIKDSNTIERIIKKDKNKFLIFKPVNDIQHTDQLLAIYPNTKSIWIYRNYNAVINSAVTKWKGAQKEIILWIKEKYEEKKLSSLNHGEDSQYATYIENINLDSIELIKDLASHDMSNEDGAALLWYIRNKIYFELNLQKDERVKLINYEDLVTNPTEKLKDIFDFIGCNFSNHYANEIRATSINKEYSFKIDPEINKICKKMLKDLDAHNNH